jgi:hypothetical protein
VTTDAAFPATPEQWRAASVATLTRFAREQPAAYSEVRDCALNGDARPGTLAAFQRMTMGERGTLASEKPDEYRRLSDAEIADRKTPRRV